MAERERRIRLAYIDGAEEWSRETVGRRLTEGELGVSSDGSGSAS
jgi:hypothetical protein